MSLRTLRMQSKEEQSDNGVTMTWELITFKKKWSNVKWNQQTEKMQKSGRQVKEDKGL